MVGEWMHQEGEHLGRGPRHQHFALQWMLLQVHQALQGDIRAEKSHQAWFGSPPQTMRLLEEVHGQPWQGEMDLPSLQVRMKPLHSGLASGFCGQILEPKPLGLHPSQNFALQTREPTELARMLPYAHWLPKMPSPSRIVACWLGRPANEHSPIASPRRDLAKTGPLMNSQRCLFGFECRKRIHLADLSHQGLQHLDGQLSAHILLVREA